MIQATELKAGTTFQLDGKPYKVLKYSFIKMGRGGAVVKVTAKNLENGTTGDRSFSSNVAVEEVSTSKKRLQYLYKDTSFVTFMDPKTYEQVAIPLSVLGDEIFYLNEGESVDVLFWSFGGAQDKDDQPLSIELPPNVVLTVSECDPGVKGNSATNIYKPAVLENGLKLKVPLFIKQGDKIRVDTKTGEYLERVK